MGTFNILDVMMLEGCRIHAHIQKGGFEPETLRAFCTYVRAGSTVIDVGAYSGLFSLLAYKMRARPIAIEPLPANIERIQQNMALNHINFELIRAAASDYDGSAVLRYNPGVRLTSGASLQQMSKNVGTLEVPTFTIDSLNAENVSVIKIDVEGHEPAVLRGAAQTIHRYRPVIIAEANTPEAADAIRKEIRGYERDHTLDGRNLIFLPRK